MVNTSRHTFPKREHLVGNTTISELFTNGDSFSAYPFRVFFYKHTKENVAPIRLLISVPKKHQRHAVDRNRIKRLAREGYRLNKSILTDFMTDKDYKLNIAVVYLKDELESFDVVENSMQKMMNKLIKKLTENV